MQMRFLVSAAVATMACAPAFAATPANWYVAQNVTSSSCIVTPTKPNGTTYTMVGSDRFPTVEAATASMRAASECVKSKTAAASATTTASTANDAPLPPPEPTIATLAQFPRERLPYDVFPDDDRNAATDDQ